MSKIQEKKAAKEHQLLAAAESLFMDKGFAETSVDEIASLAGLAKGTFYLYFEDKQALNRKLIRLKVQELFSQALVAVDETGLSAVDYIVAIVDYLIDTLAANKRLMAFIHKNLSLGVLPQALSSGEASIVEILGKKLMQSGVHPQNPTVSIFMITELVAGTCYHSIMYNQPLPIEEYKPFLYRAIRLLTLEM